MTKAELLKALEPFRDDQWVYVNLHSHNYPYGSQVAIQGVKPTEPWRGPHEESKWLVGLVAHAENATVTHKPPPKITCQGCGQRYDVFRGNLAFCSRCQGRGVSVSGGAGDDSLVADSFVVSEAS